MPSVQQGLVHSGRKKIDQEGKNINRKEACSLAKKN
jgi:hypothetical protein